MASKANLHCTFCATGIGETDDHVPPRCFFPGTFEKSPNLIKVPCCTVCHGATAKTDGLLRDFFVSLDDVEDRPTVRNWHLAKRDRSLAKGGLKPLLAMVRKLPIVTETGTSAGSVLVFEPEAQFLEAFAERLMRAMLYAECGQPYFRGSFGWQFWDQSKEEVSVFGKIVPSRVIHDDFEYSVVPISEGLAWGKIRIFSRILFIRAQVHP